MDETAREARERRERLAQRDAEEAKYYAEFDEQERLRRERRNQTPPMKWGDKMTPAGYFCTVCWKNGVEKDGFHSYDAPPCDAEPRGPFDPR